MKYIHKLITNVQRIDIELIIEKIKIKLIELFQFNQMVACNLAEMFFDFLFKRFISTFD